MNTCDEGNEQQAWIRGSAYAYHRWDFSNGGNEEPNETLANGERISACAWQTSRRARSADTPVSTLDAPDHKSRVR